MNYYNEIDPYCVRWLKNLIAAGLIPTGDVDDRDIKLVQAADLVGYAQCHFFAGIGGWSRALTLAGCSADQPVWTGSCPCQPFSSAGKRRGFADNRHLWPAWFSLIRKCRPAVVFGEQVASAKLWLDAMCADLEGSGYAFGATILPAAGIGAPHRRDRWWFIAESDSQSEHAVALHAKMARASQFVADASGAGLAFGQGLKNGHGAIWDEGKAPPSRGWWDVEPDVGRVANGVPARVAKLRALGNAIVPQVAAEFIGAHLDVAP